jgi:hypothetical protein
MYWDVPVTGVLFPAITATGAEPGIVLVVHCSDVKAELPELLVAEIE